MAKSSKQTTNATLLRLKGTPFKSASEMKGHEDKILREEWERVERARVRRQLLMKTENKVLLSPFTNGFRAKFVGVDGAPENLVRVYLTEEEMVHVEIDRDLKTHEVAQALESLVKPMVDGLMSSYLGALGLKNDSPSDGVDWNQVSKSQPIMIQKK